MTSISESESRKDDALRLLLVCHPATEEAEAEPVNASTSIASDMVAPEMREKGLLKRDGGAEPRERVEGAGEPPAKVGRDPSSSSSSRATRAPALGSSSKEDRDSIRSLVKILSLPWLSWKERMLAATCSSS